MTRAWSISMAILAGLSLGATPAQADTHEFAAELRAVVEKNIDAYERMDVDATLATLHSKSPVYLDTKEALSDDVADPKVDAELVDFDYIGHDDEFAVARAKTSTKAAPGEEGFVDNTIDVIMVFHQEDGTWKIWSQQILGVEVAR